ncbi:GPI biosynthesis protein family pig-F domain-containing protein [Sarocladium implicatum]|nr:GPI biosynthesis protein family pig-F domain-containing protein [Sarocladium implicatum]
MSSKTSPSSPSKAASSTSPSAAAPNLYPIALLDTPASLAVAHARPAVYLALLALRFGALVRDPVSELRAALPVVAAGQLAYAICCLPVAGSQEAKPSRKSRPGERKKNEVSGPRPVVSAILSLLLSAIVVPAVYILLVLFGAPFLDYTSHTMLCAAHFSLLGLFPIFYSRGVDPAALLSVAGAQAPFDEAFGGLLGAVLGAWLGAVPIPLDWDREWQRWPVTIMVGLYAGHCVGAKAGGLLFFGKRFTAAKA